MLEDSLHESPSPGGYPTADTRSEFNSFLGPPKAPHGGAGAGGSEAPALEGGADLFIKAKALRSSNRRLRGYIGSGHEDGLHNPAKTQFAAA